MPNISNINGLTLCDETNVNGVPLSDISDIDGITKSCAQCNALSMVFDGEGCTSACAGEECTTYYVNQVIACPLDEGTAIYLDAGCSECAPTGFYSPQMCEECTQCYTFNFEECSITNIAACR